MAETSYPTEIEIKAQFMLFVKPGTEKVNQSKLPDLLKSLNIKYNEEELGDLIAQIAPDEKGLFTVEQFENLAVLKPPVEEHTLQDIIQALSVFDEDEDGKLSLTELEQAMRNFGV